MILHIDIDAFDASISHETTLARDLRDARALRAWRLELTEHVARRWTRSVTESARPRSAAPPRWSTTD